MVRHCGIFLLAIGLALACGRTALDVRRGLRAEVDAGARIDAWLTRDAPLPNDAQLPMDVPPPADAQGAPDLAPTIRCAVLQPLANGVLTSRHTVRALFTPDGSSLALRVKGQGPSEGSVQDDLLLVRLPSGEVSPITRSITSADWLQPGATLLVSMARDGSSDLVVVGSDGSVLRTLVRGVCDHAAAPDGSRVFAVHDCDKNRYGTLDVIEVASGASTRLALAAGFGTWNPTDPAAVSPDGRWVAFFAKIAADGGARGSLLVVGGVDGRVDTLTSQPEAYDPWFVSDRLLLFGTGSRYGKGEIRGHVPGSGDSSYSIAANRDPGLFGYQVSPDGTWLLGAAEAADYVDEMYAIRLDGGGELRLASDLYYFRMNQLALRVFAFSAGGRVIYNSDDFKVAAVGPGGGTPTVLSGRASFLEAPRLDRVALIEWTGSASASSRLRLVDLESGADLFAYDSEGRIDAIGFQPSGRGLVFTEPRSGSTQLRFASADQSVVLGEWQTTQFRPNPWRHNYGSWFYIYPVDPTGCFTVFDTDLAPGPGTRLAVLPQ